MGCENSKNAMFWKHIKEREDLCGEYLWSRKDIKDDEKNEFVTLLTLEALQNGGRPCEEKKSVL